MELIKSRLDALRSWMKDNKIDAFIVPSTDPHDGEYVPEHWESRKWISGFTGSAGTVVVTLDNAALWTDSRYFIQAKDQLSDTGIELMKMALPDTPSIAEYLLCNLDEGCTVSFDGWCNNLLWFEDFSSEIAPKLKCTPAKTDPFESIWNNRPEIPANKIFVHDVKYSGESVSSKISRIRVAVEKLNANGIVVSALDEIAWILNLRGNDVHCNPVFVSYLLITGKDVVLYINHNKIDKDVAEYLKANNIDCKEYSDITNGNLGLNLSSENILVDKKSTSKSLFDLLLSSGCRLVDGVSPIASFKAVKTETEQNGFRNAMLKDGIALVRFEMWMEQAIKQGKETEMSIDRKLTSLRAELDLFKGISFDTIAGYEHHGAIVHYEATEETDIPVMPKGLILIDSGAQYLDGTTDITRTYALGDITDEQKRDYTLVLKGHIALSSAVFPEGTCGTQLDVLARSAMWKYGINYLHGTGHGVGSFLNVHEGPHQIRMNNMPAPLKAGMTVTDEPGIYQEGKYGIRIENTLLIVNDKETEFGKFLKFEPLTLCPIDRKPINMSMLTQAEIEWINNYHKNVYSRLSPYLSKEECEWLAKATSELK